jgi:pyruvate dehydrogenase E2 component (dihydrolipoamide acetyltransferase)|tara:strand:- start:12978 stop:14252 length:1275 start_codon:yes stop_codon:yes gene_type:complete
MAEIIEMPKLSDTMTSGTLVSWLKKEGEAVAAGDMIAEVETDKATMEVECFEDGILLKQYLSAGESVEIGGGICAVGEKGEAIPEVSNSSGGSSEPAAKEEKAEAAPQKAAEPAPVPAASPPPAASSGNDSGIKVSPLAKKIAAELGVSLSGVSGTGPGGRIVRADVEAAAKNGPTPDASAPAGPAPALLAEEIIPVTGMRSAIARALVGSKTQAPHFYLQIEVDGAPLSELRKSLNANLADLPPEQGGMKFTVNDLTLRASAEAVRRVPAINRSWMGDTIKQHGSVHLAFGVAIDDGLVTPVIRDAHAKTLSQISAEAKILIKKARGKKLKPDEMSGSTLTVTNLGMFGISDFYGIINPPNAAILSIGATIKTPVVADDGSIVVGYRMKIGLSGDHRVIDGAVGAQYLAALRDILEAPATMLV